MQLSDNQISSDAPPDKGSFREKMISTILLCVIILIALTLLTLQTRFDPARWQAQSGEAAKSAQTDGTALTDAPVPGLQSMSVPETYDAATLSDKINGKAELYLSAGFARLQTHRFSLKTSPDLWMERFIYDMGSYTNAFAVYSRQRRSQSRGFDLTPDAYGSANGIFLVQGPYYLEIIGSASSPLLIDQMTALAQAFVAAHPVETARLNERTLFPENGLVADSIKLTPTNAFGFDQFDNVFTADYQWGDETATAFISRRSTTAEATELAAAYAEFLITYGGERRNAPTDATPLQLIEILDLYEIVFSRGAFLAGVHEVNDPARGATLAEQLFNNLGQE